MASPPNLKPGISPPLKIVLLGHSICRDLNSFMITEMPNFNFDTSEVQCEFLAYGGMKIPGIYGQLKHLIKFQPQIVILLVGSCDVTAKSVPSVLVNDLLEVSRFLFKEIESINKLVFSKLLPRHPGGKYYFNTYNDIAHETNRLLLSQVKAIDNVSLFQMNLPFPCENLARYNNSFSSCFKRDGVHLNSTGLFRLSRGYRSVILGIKKNQLSCWQCHCRYAWVNLFFLVWLIWLILYQISTSAKFSKW